MHFLSLGMTWTVCSVERLSMDWFPDDRFCEGLPEAFLVLRLAYHHIPATLWIGISLCSVYEGSF